MSIMNNDNKITEPERAMVTYKTEQVAELFKVDEYTVRRWVDEGKLKAYKVGRRWIYKQEDVFDLMEKGKVNTGE